MTQRFFSNRIQRVLQAADEIVVDDGGDCMYDQILALLLVCVCVCVNMSHSLLSKSQDLILLTGCVLDKYGGVWLAIYSYTYVFYIFHILVAVFNCLFHMYITHKKELARVRSGLCVFSSCRFS